MEITEKLERAGLDKGLIDQIYLLIAERLTDIGKNVSERKKEEYEHDLDDKLAAMEKQLPEGLLDQLAYSQSHDNELFYWAGVEDGVKLTKAIMSL